MERHSERRTGQRGRRLRQPDRQNRVDRLTRRLLWELAAAVAVFTLYLSAGVWAPRQADQWRSALSELLTGSADLWDACEQLGEDLAQGEDVVTSVGDWCVSVFLPAEVESAPAETAAVSASGEAADGDSG